jgi:hypothetical protein
LGYQAPVLPVVVYNDADYYFDRMREVKDGYLFLGNPYFIEHHEDPPPAFFLADWLSAIPLLLGIPLMMTVLINFFLWSFLFFLLVFLLLRLLNLSPRWSFWGSIIVYSEVYMLMIRPVSMQVVFPFFLIFLIAFLLWLKETASRKRQVALALSAAFTAYIYTYAWQIVIVAFLLTPILFYLTNRRDSLGAYFKMSGMFVLASIPLVLYTMKQVAHPLYWETMQRIGLVNTHVPTVAVVYVSIWIVAMLCFAVMLARHDRRVGVMRTHGVHFAFFLLLGLAMIAVTFSNIITGKDLELPQHIERFIVLWLGLASVYMAHFLSRDYAQQAFSQIGFVFGALCIAVIFVGNLHYMHIWGPGIIFNKHYDFARAKKIQGFDVPLTWLRENVKEPA